MLVWVLDWLAGDFPGAREAAKMTFRAGMAAAVSFALAMLLGPRLIDWLRRRFREPIVSASDRLNELHAAKAWTPTLGGLFIVAGILGGGLLFGDLSNPYLVATLALTLGLALVGAVDDLTKLLTRVGGMSARRKLAGQLVVATIAAFILYRLQRDVPGGLDLSVPLCGCRLELGRWFMPLAVLVIVGSANAVNLTDGLDGLAGGCLLFAIAGMGLAAYVAGHAELARYFGITAISGAGEATIVAGAAIGALLGFLWFNCHPAQVFMGDTGSLPLGGLLGMLALVARQEPLLLVVGGVFVAEALSVIVQVASYRWRQKRVLLCAPLHHHFQFKGWPESRIVVRFWIASALCMLVGLISMRSAERGDVGLTPDGLLGNSLLESSATPETPPGTARVQRSQSSR